MRKTAFLLAAGLLEIAAVGQAQTTPVQQAPDITPKPELIDINDALVEFGRNSQTNFIADATRFSDETAPSTADSKVTMERFLEVLSAKQKLSWLPREDMVLVWASPDLRRLGQQLLAGDSIKRIVPEPPTQGATSIKTAPSKKAADLQAPSQEEILFQDVAAYMRETHGWDDKTPGSAKEVRISALPPSLYSRVGAAVQTSLLIPESSTIWEAWFSDEFWNKAQLGVMHETNGNQNPNAPKIPVLVVGGEIENKAMRGGSMMSLGAIKGLPKF